LIYTKMSRKQIFHCLCFRLNIVFLCVLIQGCMAERENLRDLPINVKQLGDYRYTLDLNYSNGFDNEVITLFLDNPLSYKGERNCFWMGQAWIGSVPLSDSNIAYSCAMRVGPWRPWGRKLRIKLDVAINDAERYLLGRISNNRSNGKIIFSDHNENEIGFFRAEKALR